MHAVAVHLRDKAKLATILPRPASNAIHEILVKAGNELGHSKKKLLGETRVEEIIVEMRELRQAREKREYTPLQLQLLFAVFPLSTRSTLVRLARLPMTAKRLVT